MRHRPSPLLSLSAGAGQLESPPVSSKFDDVTATVGGAGRGAVTPTAAAAPSPSATSPSFNLRTVSSVYSPDSPITAFPSPSFLHPSATLPPPSPHRAHPQSPSYYYRGNSTNHRNNSTNPNLIQPAVPPHIPDVLSSSPSTPLFVPKMFRLGARSKSPGTAPSMLYHSGPGGGGGGGTGGGVGGGSSNGGRTSPKTISSPPPAIRHDHGVPPLPRSPHQKSFLPWNSLDARSNSSPSSPSRGIYSSARAPHRGFHHHHHHHNHQKRPSSPTTSVSTGTTGTASTMSKASARSFLGRPRKQTGLSSNPEEFDPTTFRKNRSRPSRVGGQDAVYQEYDDLFVEDGDDRYSLALDDDLDSPHTDGSGGSGGGGGLDDDDDDGFFILQNDDHPPIPPLREKPKRSKTVGPLGDLYPVPNTEATSQQNQKMWRRSIETTTPPRSTAASVVESLEHPTTMVVSPPTPPTPAKSTSSYASDIQQRLEDSENNNPAYGLRRGSPAALNLKKKNISNFGASNNSEDLHPYAQPHHQPQQKHKQTFLHPNGNEANCDGLAVINIPSPTLFRDGTSPVLAGFCYPGSPPPPPPKSFPPKSSPPKSSPPKNSAHLLTPLRNTAHHTLKAVKSASNLFSKGTSVLLDPDDPCDGVVEVAPLDFDKSPLTPHDGCKLIGNFKAGAQDNIVVDEDVSTSVDKMLSDMLGATASNGTKRPPSRGNLAEIAIKDGALPGKDGAICDSGLEVCSGNQSKREHGRMPTLTVIEQKDDRKSTVVMTKMKAASAREDIAKERRARSSSSPPPPPLPAKEGCNIPGSAPPLPTPKIDEDGKPDTAYLRAFRAFVKVSRDEDAFISREPRFEAIQAHRICSPLRQDYPLQVTGTKKKRPRRNSKVRLREAGEEIMTSLWALMAGRWLNFGRIVFSPAHDQLVAATAWRPTLKGDEDIQVATPTTTSAAGKGRRGTTGSLEDKERRRVLDLGGMPVADWGWHCAMDYPAVKVYTVTQRHHKPISPTGTDQPVSPTTNPQFRGPRNHRHLSVERLYRLPFPDNHFDVVSARTIFLILKTQALNKPAGQLIDEYNRCIEECMRVLKPGGYFEFMLFDSDIINAGPLASELCARFSVSLTSTGRDPEPTKMWITRLNNAGFHDIKRSWVFLPMSPPVQKPRVPSKDEKECPHLPPIPPAGASGSTLQAQQQQQWQPLNTDSQDLDDVKEQVRRKLRAWDSAATSNAAQNPSTTSTTASKDPKKVEKPLMGSVADVAAVSGLLTGWTWERWLRNAGIVDEEETVGNMMEEAKEMGSGLRCLVGWARKGVAAATAVTITAS